VLHRGGAGVLVNMHDLETSLCCLLRTEHPTPRCAVSR
jgi:hypothetical protein